MPKNATVWFVGAAFSAVLAASPAHAQQRTVTFWPREGQSTNWPFVTVNTNRQFPADPARIHLALDGAPLDWASHVQSFNPTYLYLCLGTLRGWGSHGPIVEDFADGPHVFGISRWTRTTAPPPPRRSPSSRIGPRRWSPSTRPAW